MPWQEVSTVSLRQEFITLVQQGVVSLSELCRRYGISRKTGYRWLGRSRHEGGSGLTNRSSRRHGSPRSTAFALEAAVVTLRREHPAWGARLPRHPLRS